LNHTRTGKTNWEKVIAEGRVRNGGIGATPASESCEGAA